MSIIINDTTPFVELVSADSQTVFTYTFPVFDSGDIKVYVNEVEVTDFSVTGVEEQNGGTVVLATALQLNDSVVIYRDIPIDRLSTFIENGPLLAESFNKEFNRIIAMLQDRGVFDRGVVSFNPISNNIGQLSATAQERAHKVLSFDANGALIANQEIGNWKGEWSVSTTYNARDIVKLGLIVSIALVETTENPSQNSSQWAILMDGTEIEELLAIARLSEQNASVSAERAKNAADISTGIDISSKVDTEAGKGLIIDLPETDGNYQATVSGAGSIQTWTIAAALYDNEKARDALAISDTNGTLTYTDDDDAVQTFDVITEVKADGTTLTRVNGVVDFNKDDLGITAIALSNGSTDSGKYILANANGKIDSSFLIPLTLGRQEAYATKALRNGDTSAIWTGGISVITSGDDAGAYLYIGEAQTVPAATTDSDWALMSPPGGGATAEQGVLADNSVQSVQVEGTELPETAGVVNVTKASLNLGTMSEESTDDYDNITELQTKLDLKLDATGTSTLVKYTDLSDNADLTGSDIAVDFSTDDTYFFEIDFQSTTPPNGFNNFVIQIDGVTLMHVYGNHGSGDWTDVNGVKDGAQPAVGAPRYRGGLIGIGQGTNEELAADIALILPVFWNSRSVTGYKAEAIGTKIIISSATTIGTVTSTVTLDWILAITEPAFQNRVTAKVENKPNIPLYGATGVVGAPSVIEILFDSSLFVSVANNGIGISGLTNAMSKDSTRTQINLNIENSNKGFWGNLAGNLNLFTLLSRSDNLANWLNDMGSMLSNPRKDTALGGNPLVTFSSPVVAADLFNFTTEIVDGNKIVMTSTSAVNWSGITPTITAPVGGVLQPAFVSATLTTDGGQSYIPIAGHTYNQGDMIRHPDIDGKVYAQMANNSITTTTDVLELPGTLSTWKEL